MLIEQNYINIAERAKEIAKESEPTPEVKVVAAGTEEKAANYDLSDFVYKTPFLNEAAPLNKTADYLKAAMGWVYACVGVIADEVAAINLHLYKQSKGGVQEVETHPILDLLYKANNFTTKFDLFWSIQASLDLTGEAPLFLATNGKEITDILLLRPDLIKPIPGTKGNNFVDGYKYKVDAYKDITLQPEEVIFLKYPDLTRPFRGKGTLQAAAKTVDIDNFSEDYNRNFYYNSAMPGSILQTENKLRPEVKKYLKHQVDKLYGGVSNAHKTLLLEQGLKWERMQISQKDMDFLEQQRFSRDKILGIFRVPKSALGITDDVNRANAEATDYVFAKRTIKPKMKRLIEQLNEFLVPLFTGSEGLYLDFDDPVPENDELVIKKYESGLKAGYYTINEVRDAEGKEPIGPEGDVVYLPANLVPYGKKSGKNSKNISIDKKYLSARNRKANAVKEKQEKIEAAIAEKITALYKQMSGNKLRKDQEGPFHGFWEAKVKVAQNFEKLWKMKAEALFSTQASEVLSRIPKKAVDKDDIKKWLLKKEVERPRNKKFYKALAEEIIKQGSREGFALLGLDKEIDVSNPVVQKYLEESIFRLADATTEETNAKLGKELAEGVESGEGVPKLRKRVQSVFSSMAKYRAERIARSEVIRATNWGTEKAYKESGVVEGKVWLTATDERTCEFCGPLDGREVGLSKNYFNKGDDVSGSEGGTLSVNYDNVAVPPLHPNCRCTIIPKIKS